MRTKVKISTTRDTSKFRYRGKVYNTPVYLNLGAITQRGYESEFAVTHYRQYLFIKFRYFLHLMWCAITIQSPNLRISVTGFNDKGYRHG